MRQAEGMFGVSKRNDIPGSFHPVASPGEGDEINEGIRVIAAAFQDAVTDVLVAKAFNAAEMRRVDKLIVCGGVAANGALREKMAAEGKRWGIESVFPSARLCTDNAAMIAARAETLLAAGMVDGLDFGAMSRW